MQQSYWRERLSALMQKEQGVSGSDEINVGQRLQSLRISQGLSLRALAELSGLNVNTLSLIENEKTSPNVSTLQQLATALRVPITEFFENSYRRDEVVFQKWGQRPGTTFPHGTLEDLGGGLALGEATPLLMTAYPGTQSAFESITHTGQEFIYCLEGQLTYQVGNETHLLEKGDSLIFEAHLPHRWENRGDSLCRIILVIRPADHGDSAIERHLIQEEN